MERETKYKFILGENFAFRKEERLCSKKIIEKLFSDGESILVYPVKVLFLKIPLSSDYPAQAAFSVGRRNFKKAYQRNRLKRMMREGYRLNKNSLYNSIQQSQYAVFFIYIGKEMSGFKTVESAIKKALSGIKESISQVN